MSKSKVSWTNFAFNPYTWNCTTVSPGCKHCYARARAEKYPQNSATGEFDNPPLWRENAVEELRKMPKGNLVFVNDHSDTYHEAALLGWIRRIHTLIGQYPGQMFQVLTKRPERALNIAHMVQWPDNLWFGVSVESPAFLHRLNTLFAIPAKHRFVSFEPLLKPITSGELLAANAQKLDWMIVGGESGLGFRPFKPEWLEPFLQIREKFHIPLFYKQGNGVFPDQNREYKGETFNEYPPEFNTLQARFVKPTQERLW